MRRTYGFFISILILFSPGILLAQDTIQFPLKIRAGFDISGPAVYFADKNKLGLEGYLSADRNEKMSYVLEAGHLKYQYSQYNYNYLTKGIFFRGGVDFNLLKPETSMGKYWAGIGLRYGLSIYNSETPAFQTENYWGTLKSSIPERTNVGHFIEVAPGVRTELFRNVSIGWSIRLRLLISGGGGKDLRPIYFPGFGNSSKGTNAGINYYLLWSIPYKSKRVIIKPEVKEEEPEEEMPEREPLQTQ